VSGLWQLGAVAAAGLVRRGEVGPGDLVEEALDRIERLDPALGAVVVPLADRARRKVAAGAPGPFAGVPLVLKDAGQELAGTPHWVGTRCLREAGHVSPATTELAARLEALGFVVVGKGNVPELSASASTEPPGLPPTRNPWDLGRTAGGSSGGPAAAVAAGLVALASGSDGTGSLRYTASCCGLPTLKPTAGRVPTMPAAGTPEDPPVWCDFVLARRVEDLAAVFTAVAEGPARAVRERLRVGLLATDAISGAPVDPACVEAVHRAGRLLEGLGHHVEDTWPSALTDVFAPVGGDLASAIAATRARQVAWVEHRLGRACRPGDLTDEVLATAQRARAFAPGAVEAAGGRIRAAVEPVAAWWDGWDVLVTPTMRNVPWALGSPAGPANVGAFAAVFSFTGQPALSLPLGATSEGLPVGVQLVGPRAGDELLLALAARLEEVDGWPERWPPFALR
jgi:amidase